jgi:toxin ParE1/3/4
MAREIRRRPQAHRDLIEIWSFIAADNDAAADRMLDRIDEVLRTLGDSPLIGRVRNDLAQNLRSFPVGNYIIYYVPLPNGIELIGVGSGYMDIGPEDFEPD